jgi:hypothetical protein
VRRKIPESFCFFFFRKNESVLFPKKKNKKTFVFLPSSRLAASRHRPSPRSQSAGNKSLFASFSSEKEDSLFFSRKAIVRITP